MRSSGTRRRRDRLRNATLALVCAGALVGCVVPVVQPLRISTGAWGSASLTGQIGSEPADTSAGNTGGLGLQLAGGYGHLFSEHFGLQLGLVLPALENQQGDVERMVVGSVFLGVQNEIWSGIIGTDFGGGGASLIVGGTVRIADLNPVPLRLGVYARRHWAWDPDPDDDLGNPPQVHSWDVGLRARAWIVMAQYAYYRLDHGGIHFDGFEGRSRAVNTITFGIILDAESFEVMGRM